MNKNVSVILCHPSDTTRPLSPSRTVSGTELLLIDEEPEHKKDAHKKG